MTVSVAVILACIVAGLAALVGIGIQAVLHGARMAWGWLLLPIGVILAFALVPASIGHAEGTWGTGDVRLWAAVGVGLCGAVCQVLGWRAVLRPRLRPGQCASCGYEAGGLARCPECGRPCGGGD